CSNVAISCADDGNPCTAPSCDPGTGCGFTNVADGTSCDDVDACTMGTSCVAGVCGDGMATTCVDDGNPCTAERCDPTLGCVTDAVAAGTACDDGDACTMGSVCGAGACGGGSPVVCADDGNACTAPSCDPATGCGFTNV